MRIGSISRIARIRIERGGKRKVDRKCTYVVMVEVIKKVDQMRKEGEE